MTARRLVQMRLPPELVAEVDAYALERASTRTAVVQAALENLLESSRGGVPELPPELPEPFDRVAAFRRAVGGV